MKQEMVYRVENPVDEHGIWRNFDGSPCDLFSKLTIGKCKDMPMEDNDFYLFNGKRWFSATDTPEKLKAWFDVLDIVEMRKLGYRVYRFTVSSIRTVSEYEVVFTRDSIIEKVAIDPSEIWEDIEMIAKSAQPEQIYGEDIYYEADGHCEFKCSVCGVEIGVVEGGELDGGRFKFCPKCGVPIKEMNDD